MRSTTFHQERGGPRHGPIRSDSKGFPPAGCSAAVSSAPLHRQGLGAQRGSLKAFMAIRGGAGLCGDGSSMEADDGHRNNMGTCRVPSPRHWCAFGYPQRDVHTTKSDGVEGFPTEIYSYLFMGAKILPVPHREDLPKSSL